MTFLMAPARPLARTATLVALLMRLGACDSAPNAPPLTGPAEVDSFGGETTTVPETLDTFETDTLDTSQPDTTLDPADGDTTTPEDTTMVDSATPEDTNVDTTPVDTGPPPVACATNSDCDPGLLCVDNVCSCDPTPVSFAADVVPLFKSTCGTSCHVVNSATGGSAGLNLNTNFAFAELVAKDASQRRGANADRLRLVAGDVGASYLVDKLLGRDMCSGARMPKGRAAYNATQLSTVGRWICQGALEN